MRIESLQINNFRGIPELEVNPNGDNLCLVGPNGSGKSSVIEAIDFLLTGKIKDLTGEGTGDLSIPEHGPHIRENRENSWVEATFTDGNESYTVRRNFDNRNQLESDGDLPGDIQNLIESAERGQHYLSRREILKYIVARQQSRSDEIRSLLDLDTIRDRRLELQGAAEDIDAEASQTEREFRNTRDRLFGIFDGVDSLEELRELVNDVREDLGGEPLEELTVDETFRSGLESPTERASATPLQSNQTKDLLDTINDWFEGKVEDFLNHHEEVKTSIEDVRESEEALRDLQELDLIQKGQQFIDDETTRCPLCKEPWDGEELQEYLGQREQQAVEIKRLREEIDQERDDALELLTELRTAISSLIGILEQHEGYETEPLSEFEETLENIEGCFSTDLIDEIPLEEQSPEDRKETLTPEDVRETIDSFRERASELPNLDEIEEKWDDLNSAFETYKEYHNLKEQATKIRQLAVELEEVKDEFINARDAVLNDTYTAISERFEEFYTTLHGDEEGFSPTLEPTETGLALKVGFHGEGEHPPHALHSEGHQDSMGVCLFLALCDYLESDNLSLVMLDDVVMSIDAEHRRPLAKLLKEEISEEFQLFITTHDKLWYRHLKSEGVVSSRNAVMFTSWSLEDGPVRVDQLSSGWERIENHLADGDVPAAAHRLRHTAEWFLREACHQLNARVRFKADGLWSLGDFMGPAKSKFKALMKDAKRAEQSWGNDIEEINNLDNRRGDVYRRLGMEEDAVNPNVHYNADEWASFTPDEMEEVVEAFRELYDLFWCDNCGSCLRVIEEDYQESRLLCRCGQKANWSLVEQD